MKQYKTSVVIPTFNRPEWLPHALDSALDQTVGARILVADDGDCDRTDAILRGRYGEHLRSGRIAHLRTGATEPWDNWRAGAEAVETGLMSWLQDDDVVCRRYVERIEYAFAEAERLGARPHLWMARLDCSAPCGRMALHYCHNGPFFPMETMHGVCEPCHWRDGSPLAVSSYFTSHSLSPALAYRTGPVFRASLAAQPRRMDVFIERTMPSAMALPGGVITDPATVGYWRQHDSNLSRAQHPDQPRQTRLLVRYLDDLLDRIGGWEPPFRAWLDVITPGLIACWAGQLDATEREGGESRHGAAIRRAMFDSLRGRIEFIPAPPEPRWRKAARRIRSGAARLASLVRRPTIASIIAAHGLPTDKDSVHSYASFYDKALAPYRDRPVRLLEIGAFEGGSLALWREYLGCDAEVIGVDPSPRPDADRVARGATIRRADAYDPDVAASLGSFDVVIDDGPHTLESQVAAIRLYTPRLRPGGLLVIEDVQDPDWYADLERAIPEGLAAERVDLRHVKGRYDDALFVARRPAA